MHEITKNALNSLDNLQQAKIKTPEGQKFNIGDVVRISNPRSWFSQKSFKENRLELYRISHSYFQKYGTNSMIPSEEEDLRHKKEYSLQYLKDGCTTAWYDEEELTLVASIDELNKEVETPNLDNINKLNREWHELFKSSVDDAFVQFMKGYFKKDEKTKTP